MPKDNEVDEKVRPVAWIVTNGGESCEPWLEYEQSEVDALPAVCIAEPLYSAATVAELRAEVERLRFELDMARGNYEQQTAYAITHKGALRYCNSSMRDAYSDETVRADAAERRVVELERVCAEAYQVVGVLLSDTCQFDTDHGQKILDNLSEARIAHEDVLPWASITGADPT